MSPDYRLHRRIPETLSPELLTKLYAPAKPAYPIITPEQLATFDGFLFGVPTRFGNFPVQWKVSAVLVTFFFISTHSHIRTSQSFWDSTGPQWQTGGFAGKYASVFVSTASPGGGQESTVIATLSTFTHHGIIYVPLGYSRSFGQLTNLSEVHGGTLTVSSCIGTVLLTDHHSRIPLGSRNFRRR